MPWKDEREPTIKLYMGRQIDVVQKFVEYFPRIHHIAAQPQSSRVTVKIERNTKEIDRTDYLHVDVQRHLMVIKRQQDRMRVKCSTRFSLCEKIRSRTLVIPRTWIGEKVVFDQ